MMFQNQAHIVGWNLKSQICWQSLVEMIDWMFALLNFWFSHQTKGAFCLIKLELISLTFWWSSTSHQHYCKPESIAFGSVSMSFGYQKPCLCLCWKFQKKQNCSATPAFGFIQKKLRKLFLRYGGFECFSKKNFWRWLLRLIFSFLLFWLLHKSWSTADRIRDAVPGRRRAESSPCPAFAAHLINFCLKTLGCQKNGLSEINNFDNGRFFTTME